MAKVTEEKRLNMVWNGVSIVNISREFLNSNGAEKHQNVHVEKGSVWQPQWAGLTFSQKMKSMVGDLNVCSKKGLSERFDSTIGAATVLMPFGGAYQLTPQNAMVAKLPVDGETSTCSGMAWGYNPYLMSANQYVGARMAVIESVTKLVATGFRYEDAYLTFQEYFERAHWMHRSVWALLPSAARTVCPAPLNSWMCLPRWCPLPLPSARQAA